MKFLRKLRALFRKERLDAEMSDEMRAHLELQAEENARRGMSVDDARYAAQRTFGGIEQLKERARDELRWMWLEQLIQDGRIGVRSLRKSPGFTLVAVLTLALGIGATTAIFSLTNAALLRGLPFPDADRLGVVWAENSDRTAALPILPAANSDIAAWRESSQSFSRVAGFTPQAVDLVDGGEPERVNGAQVTAGFFEALGVAPLLGRTLRADEEGPGAPRAVVIGHGLWQRRFHGDPAVVGRAITINGNPVTVAGIMPPDFDFPRAAEWPSFYTFGPRSELWLPLEFGPSEWQRQEQRQLATLVRLQSGTDLRQAQAELDAFAAREARAHPSTRQGWTLRLTTLQAQIAGKSRAALMILFAAAGLLLLIACVNVANLLFARGVARQREMALRAALGAGRNRLVRQLITECLVLAGAGSVLGVGVAAGCLNLFLALNPLTPSRLNDAALDPAALGFAALVALGTSVVFGLAPALEASRIDLRQAFESGGRGATGFVRERVRRGFVVVEVALAVILLTAAGLMVRSFLRVQGVQPGFQSAGVLLFDVQLPASRYRGAAATQFFSQLETRLRAIPGVRAAGGISLLPLDEGGNWTNFTLEGEPPVAAGREPGTERRWLTPGYFEAMGIPLRRGRAFLPTDDTGQPLVVVVNETLAERFFGGRDPVGRRLKVGTSPTASWRTIVGVVANVKSGALENEIGPQLYVPRAQWAWDGITMAVSTGSNPQAFAAEVRAQLKTIDPLLPAARMRTMQDVVSHATSARRFNMALLVFFAGTALLLTMIGLYGVVAFLVGRRRQEIGVRLALGAQRRAIHALVIRQGMAPVGLGLAVGLAGSLATTRLVANQLYGISAWDPLTLGAILVVLIAAALLACWLPAWRAAKTDPMIALRSE